MIIAKFGGTSVKDRDAIVRLIAIIRAARQAAGQPESTDWRGPVVVVSALGGATDKLLAAANDAGAGDVRSAIEVLGGLRARHLEVASLIGTAAARPALESIIHQEFDELERIVGALAVLREVTPRWLDVIAGAGEILSSHIVAAALTAHGLPATWVDARKVIVTGDEHMAAPPLMKET